jgi:hypothetical protein
VRRAQDQARMSSGAASQFAALRAAITRHRPATRQANWSAGPGGAAGGTNGKGTRGQRPGQA